MKKRQWIIWFAAGSLVLAACGGGSGTPVLDVATAKVATCDFSAAMTPDAPERYRAWVLFKVENPQGVAPRFGVPDDKGLTLLKAGEDNYVIVRADVVDGNEGYTLVVPVDAANEDQFNAAYERLTALVGEQGSVLRVVAHFPTPPHRSSTFVTEKELSGCFLPEYSPPGRHPHSPGANPWG